VVWLWTFGAHIGRIVIMDSGFAGFRPRPGMTGALPLRGAPVKT